MKRYLIPLSLCILGAVAVPLSAEAQYSKIANGLTNVLMPAVSGASNYKGFIEADYTQGIGYYRSNFATISTTQGYQFNNWFYMGAGLGVDFMWSYVQDDWGHTWQPGNPGWNNKDYASKAVMIPVFSDFRFTLGSRRQTSFFIDLKVGASFLCSDSNVKIRNGYLTNNSYFYLQPAIGLRIPVNSNDSRKAVNIGLHYKLITADYWGGWQSHIVQNGLGANLSFEW